MIHGGYTFKLGEFDCVSLSDGSHDYKPEDFFENVPKEQVEEALRNEGLPTEHVTTPYTYLFVNTGMHRVLIDAGAGKLFPTTGELPRNMAEAGIDAAEIDTVVITHAHPDHVGGVVDENGKALCPNARHFISKKEWDFWFSDEAFDAFKEHADLYVNFARNALKPIGMKVDRVDSLDGEPEIVPGISQIDAPGHSPGHVVVAVSSGDEKLYYIGDTVLYPLHLEHPDWFPVYDVLPDEADQSKRRIFNRVARENAWVIGQHFPPFPSLGHVVKTGGGWKWQPIGSIG